MILITTTCNATDKSIFLINAVYFARGLAILAGLAMLSGCVSFAPLAKPPVSSHTAVQHRKATPSRLISIPIESADMASFRFWKEINHWQGVPYRYGGTSTKGVDCSGLALRLYKHLYGIQLPRTTRQQIHIGVPVPRKSLKPGDLVFFRFRNNSRHVGIYLSENRFTHASRKKKRVIISRLDSPFWRSRYKTARRVLEQPPKCLASPRPDIQISDRTIH